MLGSVHSNCVRWENHKLTMNITLHNKHTGAVAEAPTGFSWTSLFFGICVPAIRGDWSSFFKLLLLTIITLGIYHYVFCFKYNKDFIKALIMKGYLPANDQAETYLKMNGLYVSQNQNN